jgi:tetratricopeptide (TPR) repeat protein
MNPLVLSITAFLALQEDTLERARALSESGRAAEAAKLLEARTRTEPRAPELAYLAQLQAEAGAVPQAVESLRRALLLAPGEDGLRVTLGAMLFELRRYDEARSELELAIARRAGSALAHYYLSAVYQGLSRLDDAEAAVRRAIEISPLPARAPLAASGPAPSIAARHLLAEIRFERGETESLESILREVLEVEPDLASPRYLLARLLTRLGRPVEAENELARFDRVKRAEAHIAQGLDLSRLGRREEAIAELNLALEAHPDHARALFQLGRELLRAGRRNEALPLLDRALAIRPDAKAEVDRLLDSFP